VVLFDPKPQFKGILVALKLGIGQHGLNRGVARSSTVTTSSQVAASMTW
jgi:hypothetical protein